MAVEISSSTTQTAILLPGDYEREIDFKEIFISATNVP